MLLLMLLCIRGLCIRGGGEGRHSGERIPPLSKLEVGGIELGCPDVEQKGVEGVASLLCLCSICGQARGRVARGTHIQRREKYPN